MLAFMFLGTLSNPPSMPRSGQRNVTPELRVAIVLHLT
jgi:hypothetical protein